MPTVGKPSPDLTPVKMQAKGALLLSASRAPKRKAPLSAARAVLHSWNQRQTYINCGPGREEDSQHTLTIIFHSCNIQQPHREKRQEFVLLGLHLTMPSHWNVQAKVTHGTQWSSFLTRLGPRPGFFHVVCITCNNFYSTLIQDASESSTRAGSNSCEVSYTLNHSHNLHLEYLNF